VIIVSDDSFTNRAPDTVFGVPAEVAAYVRAHPDRPD